MRVKVIKTYRDKDTKTLHRKNKEIEITNERYVEINSTSHGAFVEEVTEINNKVMTEKVVKSKEPIDKKAVSKKTSKK